MRCIVSTRCPGMWVAVNFRVMMFMQPVCQLARDKKHQRTALTRSTQETISNHNTTQESSTKLHVDLSL